MIPWVERPTLTTDLDGDWERLELPEDALAAARRLLEYIKGQLPGGAGVLAWLANLRTWGRFHRELQGMAQRAAVDWRDLMVANLSYDLVLAQLGCSTIALATADGPILARNMDWWPEDLLAQASWLVRCERQGRLAFASAGWPGAVGVVTGMSARGFACALNAVSSPEGMARTGYPMLLFLRTVLEDAKDFDQAVHMCCEQRLFAPGLITLVGVDNKQRAVVERTPSRHAVRRPAGDEPLFATNDYRKLFPPQARAGPEFYQTTCSRYETLGEMFSAGTARRQVSDQELLYRLTDPRVLQEITAQHIVMRPRKQAMRLYVPRRLLARHES